MLNEGSAQRRHSETMSGRIMPRMSAALLGRGGACRNSGAASRASTLLALQLVWRVLMLPLWLLPLWLQLVLLPLLLVGLLQVLLLLRRRLEEAPIGSSRMASDALAIRLEPLLAFSSRLRNSSSSSLTSSNCTRRSATGHLTTGGVSNRKTWNTHASDAVNSDMRRCSRAGTSMWGGPSTGVHCLWILHTALPL